MPNVLIPNGSLSCWWALIVFALTKPAEAQVDDWASSNRGYSSSNAPPTGSSGLSADPPGRNATPGSPDATRPNSTPPPLSPETMHAAPRPPSAAVATTPPPTASFPTLPPNPQFPSTQQATQPTPQYHAHQVDAPATNIHSAPPVTSEPPAPPEPRPDDDSSSDLIRLGPVVGVGLPSLLNFGVLVKLTRYLGGGVNIGLIPSTKISYYGEATLSYQEYDVFGRIHPFGGGFFLGAGLGYAAIKGTAEDNLDTSPYASQLPPNLAIPGSLTYASQGSVKTMVFTPQIGYFYTTDVGFSIGIDVGAQLPIAPSQVNYHSQVALPTATPQAVVDQIRTQFLDPTDKQVRDTLETIGRTPIPTVNLRIGWLL